MSKSTKSSFKTVPSADSNTLVEVLSLRDEETLDINDIKVEYSGGATVDNILVELHDEDEGNSVGDTSESDAFDVVEVANGDRVHLTDIERDHIEEAVMVVVDRVGSGVDGDMYITIGGELVTS